MLAVVTAAAATAAAVTAAAVKYNEVTGDGQKLKGIKGTEHKENTRPFEFNSTLLSAFCPSYPLKI